MPRDFEVVPEIIVSVGRAKTQTIGAPKLLAFYGSTPAYRPVLDAHGWGDLQPELNAMSKQGRWQEMASLSTTRCCTPSPRAARPPRSPRTSATGSTGWRTGSVSTSPDPIAVESLAAIVDALGS